MEEYSSAKKHYYSAKKQHYSEKTVEKPILQN